MKVYGIKNCNSMKKAFNFLESNSIKYSFIDFKKEKISKDFIEGILSKITIDDLVNKKGTTYKKIKDQFELATSDEKIDLILQNLSIIKRPLIIFSKNLSKDKNSYKEVVFVGLEKLFSLKD